MEEEEENQIFNFKEPNLMQKIENAIKYSSSDSSDSFDHSFENTTLANDFPDSFVLDKEIQEESSNTSDISYEDFKHLYNKIMRQKKLIEYHKKHIQMEYDWIQKEKARIAKMKKETEKQVNVIENSNKVCANCQHLKDEYEQEKAQWAIEKKELLLRIQALQSFLSSDLESKKVTKTYDENAKSSKKHYKTKYEVHQLKKEKNPKSQKKIPRKSPIKYQITPIVDNIPNVYNHTKKQKIIFPIEKQHLDFKLKLNQPTTEEIKPNGQIVRKYRNGTTEIQYKDGTRKVWCGNVNYIFYTNGDIEKEFEDGVKSYKFKETGTVEISNLNNSTIYVFSNGQKEMHDMNGEISIQFPNGHTKIFNPLFDTDSSSEKSIE